MQSKSLGLCPYKTGPHPYRHPAAPVILLKKCNRRANTRISEKPIFVAFDTFVATKIDEEPENPVVVIPHVGQAFLPAETGCGSENRGYTPTIDRDWPQRGSRGGSSWIFMETIRRIF
jgi:hypothetical protein